MKKENYFKLLLSISSELYSIQNLEELYRVISKKVLEFTEAERAIFFLFENNEPKPVYIEYNFYYKDTSLLPDKWSNTVVKNAIESKKPVTFFVKPTGELAFLSKSIEALSLQAVMCAPLLSVRKTPPEILGLIYVDSRVELRVFTSEDLELFSLFANQASIALENALILQKLKKNAEELAKKVQSKFQYQNIIGKSPQIRKIYKLLETIKNTDVEVLIVGETGTGKELIAKTIHYNSKRKNKPFIQINCAALPKEIVEVELFGIEKKVATGVLAHKGKFELANNGTLFLDEIADMDIQTQVKILHFLQYKTIRKIGSFKEIKLDVRILAATNKNIEEEIKKNKFRKDLYFRLNTVVIYLPPLRERKEDILPIAYYTMEKFRKEQNLPPKILSPEAEKILLEYPWPGNIRELIQVVQRAYILANSNIIQPYHLGILDKTPYQFNLIPYNKLRENYEKQLIQKALIKFSNNIQKTAKHLGITRKTLYQKIKKYNLVV